MGIFNRELENARKATHPSDYKSPDELFGYCLEQSKLPFLSRDYINEDILTYRLAQLLSFAPYVNKNQLLVSYACDAEYGWEMDVIDVPKKKLERIPELAGNYKNQIIYETIDPVIEYCMKESRKREVAAVYVGRTFSLPRTILFKEGCIERISLANSSGKALDNQIIKYLAEKKIFYGFKGEEEASKCQIVDQDDIIMNKRDFAFLREKGVDISKVIGF